MASTRPAESRPEAPKPSPILAMIDKMIAAPAVEKKAPTSQEVNPPMKDFQPEVNRVAATSQIASQPLAGRSGPKSVDPFDETVERIREVFKGEIIP